MWHFKPELDGDAKYAVLCGLPSLFDTFLSSKQASAHKKLWELFLELYNTMHKVSVYILGG